MKFLCDEEDTQFKYRIQKLLPLSKELQKKMTMLDSREQNKLT